MTALTQFCLYSSLNYSKIFENLSKETGKKVRDELGSFQVKRGHPATIICASKVQNFLYTLFTEYCEEYNRSLVDAQQIQREVDERMSEYNAERENETKNIEPDEEGWVTVLKK